MEISRISVSRLRLQTDLMVVVCDCSLVCNVAVDRETFEYMAFVYILESVL